MVLDVVDGQVWHLTADEVMALGTRALVMREKLPDATGARWYAPLWTRVRPVILKLAAASFVINVLGLATPLFMMLMLNTVVGHAAPANAASLVMLLSAGMLLVYGLDFALRLARGWLSARTGARLDALMSGEALHHLMQLPYRHFERTPSGVIAERLRQLDVLRNFLTGQMPVLAIDIAFVALFLAATFVISPLLGAIATARHPGADRRVAGDPSRAAPPGRREFPGARRQGLDAGRDGGQRRHHQDAGARGRGREALAGARRAVGLDLVSAPTTSPTSPPAPRAACSFWPRW